MTDVYDFAECLVDSREGAVAQHLRELGGGGDLAESLDLIQRFAVRGVADSQTVE